MAPLLNKIRFKKTQFVKVHELWIVEPKRNKISKTLSMKSTISIVFIPDLLIMFKLEAHLKMEELIPKKKYNYLVVQ